MHHSNHWYGHAHAMARYCGLDELHPAPIRGVVQHGWNIVDGYGPQQSFEPGWTRFVWSEPVRRRGRATRGRGYYPIGAPWLYLLAQEPAAEDEEREGTLWYPFHGWDPQHVVGDHNGLIDEIREVEDGPVTVCLYHFEHRQEAIRGLYEQAGFRVICHGFRGWEYRHTDRRFLYRQLEEIRKHRRVASNRLSTAVFYGLSAGCDAAVYGDPMILENTHPMYGGLDRMARLWPELHGPAIDTAVAREIADVELGVRYLCEPAELRELFGWA
jgi:hypothetical protein